MAGLWPLEVVLFAATGNTSATKLARSKSASGQILSLELDMDAGILKFWRDGKPHGPGWSSGVKGRLRWAMTTFEEGTAVQIVPTPDLEPWKERDGQEDSDDDY